MLIKETHLVPPDVSSVRLSDYARTAFPQFPSRKGMAKAIKRGELWINGTPAQSGDWIQTGQILTLVDLQQRPPKTYPLPLEVIYEDESLAVINKPPGIEVSGNKFKTVENALTGSLTPSSLTDALPWPRPVHRLDYSTSGLLLVAKTASAQVALGQQFENRTLHKHYCALVMGKLTEPGKMDTEIDGLPAISNYTPIETVPSLRSGHITLVNLSPVTGRTHQLRIHMAALGHPIVGDQKYGEAGNTLKGKGLFLAAVELQFLHPTSQQETTAKIIPPLKFSSLLQREKSRWEKFNASSI
jgi:23S rRNA pseudouridine1911/1915/1917 synthase